MQITLPFIALVTLFVSEALALSGSDAAAGGLEVTSHIRRHKKHHKTCKAGGKKHHKSSHKDTKAKADAGVAHIASSGDDDNTDAGTGNTSIGSFKKLGLSWTYGKWKDINLFDKNAGWRYNWQSSDDTGSTDTKYFPMLWSDSGDRVAKWKSSVMAHPENVKSKIILGPNEPEIGGQANMSPQRVCDAMRKYMIPLKKSHGFKIIGPAIVTLEGDWYPNFVKACPDVQKEIDADAVHLYDTLASTSIERLKNWHSKYNRPILITEVACHSFYITKKAPQCTGSGMANTFYQGLTKFVADTDYMAGIAPFGVFTSSLPDGVGNFNRLATPQGTPTGLFHMISSMLAQ